jgi:hypothetical protein
MAWLAAAGWLLLAVSLVVAWRNGWRPPLMQPEPLVPRKALLLNAQGRLDSVRTITGTPPLQIVCRAGVYNRDLTAISSHLVYRRRA